MGSTQRDAISFLGGTTSAIRDLMSNNLIQKPQTGEIVLKKVAVKPITTLASPQRKRTHYE